MAAKSHVLDTFHSILGVASGYFNFCNYIPRLDMIVLSVSGWYIFPCRTAFHFSFYSESDNHSQSSCPIHDIYISGSVFLFLFFIVGRFCSLNGRFLFFLFFCEVQLHISCRISLSHSFLFCIYFSPVMIISHCDL